MQASINFVPGIIQICIQGITRSMVKTLIDDKIHYYCFRNIRTRVRLKCIYRTFSHSWGWEGTLFLTNSMEM